MANPIWKTYAVYPMGFGGIASFLTWVVPGSHDSIDAILEVRACVGATTVTDPNSTAVIPVELLNGQNTESYAQGLTPGPCVVTWFARTYNGWFLGPNEAVDLSPSWSTSFEYPKVWAILMLQQLEAESLPLGTGKHLPIRSAYPRDTFPIPCISLNFEALPSGPQILGDISQRLSQERMEERKGWTINLQIILWCDTPEDRDLLTPWLLQVTQALTHLAPYNNIVDPNYSMTETEDFSGSKSERPLFISMSQITGTMWSILDVPVHNPQGTFTV